MVTHYIISFSLIITTLLMFLAGIKSCMDLKSLKKELNFEIEIFRNNWMIEGFKFFIILYFLIISSFFLFKQKWSYFALKYGLVVLGIIFIVSFMIKITGLLWLQYMERKKDNDEDEELLTLPIGNLITGNLIGTLLLLLIQFLIFMLIDSDSFKCYFYLKVASIN